MICLLLASLTFRNLPLNGKTPYLSLPTISIPANASDLAESPSVRIIVQSQACLPPASLASSSLGIPMSLLFFLPQFRFLANLASSFALATETILSTIPDSKMSLRNFSERLQTDPKLLGLVVRVSFVYESKAGFSTRQLTNNHKFALI